MSSSTIEKISEVFVKPQFETEPEQIIHLSSWDIAMLSLNYMEQGLLFKNSPPNQENSSISTFMEKLENSLRVTLIELYSLSGRLATIREENPLHKYIVYVDCKNSPGAKLIQAKVDLSVSDIIDKTYVPEVVHYFFDHYRKVNHDGHTESLLSIQVTELKDGIFIGISMNHAIGDGISLWIFWENLSRNFEESGGKINAIIPMISSSSSTNNINPLLVQTRWFPDGHDKIINLPFKHEDEFVSRFEFPPFLERFFHFSSESIKKIKEKANIAECKSCSNNKISSFQSLAALVWRSITRSRNLPYDQITSCRMAINNRTRLNPPISDNYFGNCLQAIVGSATVGELLDNDLGFAAMVVHKAVANHCDEHVRAFLQGTQVIYNLNRSNYGSGVSMGNSPRFNMYGNEIGMGKAIAIRSGYGNKFDGKVMSYPGRDGGGSVDMEICLSPENMKAIESDFEFMSLVSAV